MDEASGQSDATRHWAPRFRLSTLLLLVACCGLGIGLWFESRKREEAEAALAKHRERDMQALKEVILSAVESRDPERISSALKYAVSTGNRGWLNWQIEYRKILVTNDFIIFLFEEWEGPSKSGTWTTWVTISKMDWDAKMLGSSRSSHSGRLEIRDVFFGDHNLYGMVLDLNTGKSTKRLLERDVTLIPRGDQHKP